MSHSAQMAARLVDLPLMLAERPYNQKELAGHFNTDRKTIKSSIDALKKHYKIIERHEGRNVLYHIVGGKRLNFTPLEMAALLLAQEAIGATSLTAISSPFAPYAGRRCKRR
jgi:predicted DNA-binding transcriptional regulator YafY